MPMFIVGHRTAQRPLRASRRLARNRVHGPGRSPQTTGAALFDVPRPGPGAAPIEGSPRSYDRKPMTSADRLEHLGRRLARYVCRAAGVVGLAVSAIMMLVLGPVLILALLGGDSSGVTTFALEWIVFFAILVWVVVMGLARFLSAAITSSGSCRRRFRRRVRLAAHRRTNARHLVRTQFVRLRDQPLVRHHLHLPSRQGASDAGASARVVDRRAALTAIVPYVPNGATQPMACLQHLDIRQRQVDDARALGSESRRVTWSS